MKIDGFSIDAHKMDDVGVLLLAIAIDPTPKQKEVLDAFNIRMCDTNGKLIYPRTNDVASE